MILFRRLKNKAELKILPLLKMFKRMGLTIYMFWVLYLERKRYKKVPNIGSKEGLKLAYRSFWEKDAGLKGKLEFLYRYPFRHFSLPTAIFKYLFLDKTLRSNESVIVYHDDYRPLGPSIDGLVGLAWFCEKMGISIQIKRPSRMVWRHFANNLLINTKDGLVPSFKLSSTLFLSHCMIWVGMFLVSSEDGHKILSKLSIKENLRQFADKWFARHINGDCIAVHYRGTDIRKYRHSRFRHRYRIELDSYITYLKEVLDDKCIIFACSDQAQFIDKMRVTFPGRVYARNIKRSYNDKPIHLHGVLHGQADNYHQERDALIDLLILAKAELIYTTGSRIVDLVRYFNPKIRIVSLDERRIGGGKNYMPIPKKDLFDKLLLPL